MTTDSNTEHHCEPCHKVVASSKKKERAGILTSVLLILLPKCPFCLMAYTSTLMLCEKGSNMQMGDSSFPTTLIITAIFLLVVYLSIIFNYRDKRTIYSLTLVTVGSILILFSATENGGLSLYYSGILFLFVGVWLNSSLLSFIRKIKHRFSITTSNQSM